MKWTVLVPRSQAAVSNLCSSIGDLGCYCGSYGAATNCIYIRLMHQGMVDNNQPRARPLCRSKGSRSLLLQRTNPMIARLLYGSPNFSALRQCGTKAFPPTHTINVVYLTQQQQVQLLTSLAMTQFGLSIEHITFPTPSRNATCYATDAGYRLHRNTAAEQ